MKENNTISREPKAPRDPKAKRKGFYIMRNKAIDGSIQPDGRGIQFLYLDGGRLESFARIAGNIADEEILKLLGTAEGFHRLVHSMGVTVELIEGASRQVDFVFQMYGKKDAYSSGTQIRVPVPADGIEQILELDSCEWSEGDAVPGQIRFEFPAAGEMAKVSVKLYLQDGFEAPEEIEEETADLESHWYGKLLEKSLLQAGNPARLQAAIDRARQGEDVTVAFIGGSITQGAGAIPINRECYAYKAFEQFCRLAGRGTEDNVHYIKAGVGGTPSELGMLRYERDVCREGSVEPDVVVVEFAVNDAGDETGGECYDSLVRKILAAEKKPAVILLFAVFADDWNLQERLSPVGRAYGLPMVSVRDAVVEQFYRTPETGRVFGKNLFFYDCFHPTNLGHQVMADCIGYLLRYADAMPRQADTLDLKAVCPPLGGEFEKVKLFDRNSRAEGIQVDCGSFCAWDRELQAVEMDVDLEPTGEFPYNWMHRGRKGGSSAAEVLGKECSPVAGSASAACGALATDLAGKQDVAEGILAEKPFSMDITCTALLLIYKDSGSSAVGRGEVFVDGEKVLTADPHVNGWIHCNPVICFRGRERRRYHVEVRMEPGCEDKEFTILGFGYVQ